MMHHGAAKKEATGTPSSPVSPHLQPSPNKAFRAPEIPFPVWLLQRWKSAECRRALLTEPSDWRGGFSLMQSIAHNAGCLKP
jgi:hypothetical protein